MFRPATRSSAWLRLALCGPSGSGKTYSALRIAQGLGGRIALIDTERGSAGLYSHLCAFDVAQLAAPFTPGRYIAAMQAAEQGDYDVLVIDSLSHAWAGPGGVLEMQDRAAKALRNSFAAWREVTPEHNSLVEALLESRCHIIATMRTKTAYEVQQDGNKTRVQKVGLAPVQRDGLEYEFTVVLDLAVEGHVATGSKDRTGLFDGQHFVPDETTGRMLRDWLAGAQAARGTTEPLLRQLEQALELLGLGDLRGAYQERVCGLHAIARIEELEQSALQDELEMLRQCWRKPSLLQQLRSELTGLQAA